jgi:hypothetical protein
MPGGRAGAARACLQPGEARLEAFTSRRKVRAKGYGGAGRAGGGRNRLREAPEGLGAGGGKASGGRAVSGASGGGPESSRSRQGRGEKRRNHTVPLQWAAWRRSGESPAASLHQYKGSPCPLKADFAWEGGKSGEVRKNRPATACPEGSGAGSSRAALGQDYPGLFRLSRGQSEEHGAAEGNRGETGRRLSNPWRRRRGASGLYAQGKPRGARHF